MYKLNKFCNIIFDLRKEQGWTQTMLAERLGISPQSVSKWECGVGFPDVTLFPIIAELFGVPIGVLFGETKKEDIKMSSLVNEKKFVFEPLKDIEITVGNTCIIEVIDGESENSAMTVSGDATFMEFFSVEKENGRLRVCVKNPSGSDICQIYDRGGYQKENRIEIHSGVAESNCTVTNYLNNMSCSCCDIKNSMKWVAERITEEELKEINQLVKAQG